MEGPDVVTTGTRARAIEILERAILMEAKAMLAHRGLARRSVTRTYQALHRLMARECHERLMELREARQELRR